MAKHNDHSYIDLQLEQCWGSTDIRRPHNVSTLYAGSRAVLMVVKDNDNNYDYVFVKLKQHRSFTTDVSTPFVGNRAVLMAVKNNHDNHDNTQLKQHRSSYHVND
jgi:hypothetical protein